MLQSDSIKLSCRLHLEPLKLDPRSGPGLRSATRSLGWRVAVGATANCRGAAQDPPSHWQARIIDMDRQLAVSQPCLLLIAPVVGLVGCAIFSTVPPGHRYETTHFRVAVLRTRSRRSRSGGDDNMRLAGHYTCTVLHNSKEPKVDRDVICHCPPFPGARTSIQDTHTHTHTQSALNTLRLG
jgi:hypothetical protein